MTTLQAYLKHPKTIRALTSKPGDEGFSLIELVVVVAVLAILAAIAIPSFTSINDKAKATGAANTVAQIAKECAVKIANNETPTFSTPSLSGYAVTPTGASNCLGGVGSVITATSDTPAKYPTFSYNVSTGSKDCSHGAGAVPLHGCSTGTGGKW